MHVAPDRLRRNRVLRALEDERLGPHLRQVGPVVGEERHAGEVLGDLRVGAAEAVGELLAELRAGPGCP